MLSRISSILFVCLLSLRLCSCGGSSGPPPTQNPVPAIQSISPSGAAAGTNGFTLTIVGSNFVSSSTVSWNGAARQATFVNASELTVAISSADLATSGSATVAVSNPPPGGGQASSNFTILSPAAPAVASVLPSAVIVGSGPVSLTVMGSWFVTSSVVQWNGSNRSTTYVSNTELTAAIPSSDLSSAIANVPITVVTPSPGGGSSNSASVTVQYPLPAISSLAPGQVILGGPAFTLTVNGSNFVNGAMVYWNNLSRATTFVSSTQLSASILSSDLALPSANSASITVQNPSPSAGASNIMNLVLENPAPQIASVSPTSALAGLSVSIAITGSGFVPGATVQLGSQSFPTNTVTPSSLSAQVNASVGSLALTISNPSPSAGSSNAVKFAGLAAGPGANLVPVSIDPSGNTLGSTSSGAISSTGRYYAFFAAIPDGYLRDTCLGGPAGCQPSTIGFPLEDSVGCLTAGPYIHSVSMTGRYVSYSWFCATDPIIANLEIADTCVGVSGCTQSSQQIDTQAVYSASFLIPSARYLSYGSQPTTTGFQGKAFDTCIGGVPGCTQTSVSVTNAFVTSVAVPSSDGRFYVYSQSQFFGTDSSQINLHDSCLGAAIGCAPSDNTVSATGCYLPSVSSDAQYLTYVCTTGIFLQATCLGTTTGCSTTPSQVTPPFPYGFQAAPLVSVGGRFVVFAAAGGTIMSQQITSSMIWVYDSCNGAAAGCVKQIVPASLSSDGAVPNGDCTLGGMSADGQYIVFQSRASNLSIPEAGAYIVKNPLF